jgi:hypothetical protein
MLAGCTIKRPGRKPTDLQVPVKAFLNIPRWLLMFADQRKPSHLPSVQGSASRARCDNCVTLRAVGVGRPKPGKLVEL